MLWRCWLGGRKGIRPVKNWVVGCWRGYLSGIKVQTCICSSWRYCHSLSLASVKSILVFPFWYRLTRVVPDKGPLNGRVCVQPRQLGCQDATVRICCWAPCCGTVAAGRQAPATVDGYLLQARRSAANRRTPLLRSSDRTDRQTDGRSTVTQSPLCVLCGRCQRAFRFYYCGISWKKVYCSVSIKCGV